MSRRLPAAFLLLAWLCASGAMLDVAQVFAWARMFQGYARTESISIAARDTFDPDRPCPICRALSRARQAAAQHPAAVRAPGLDKVVLILERSTPFVAAAPRTGWAEWTPGPEPAHCADVPVPPPRRVCA